VQSLRDLLREALPVGRKKQAAAVGKFREFMVALSECDQVVAEAARLEGGELDGSAAPIRKFRPAGQDMARLNPIQAGTGTERARTGYFSTYKPHTSHILHAGPHISHRTRRVSYHFLPAEFGPLVCLNAVGPRLLRVQARWPVCPRPA